MARADGLYSRVISWLKILLPMAALVLMSTLFLMSRASDPTQSIPFADALRDDAPDRQQVSAPYFAGTTLRGDILTMTARTARPVGEEILADELETHLRLQDGSEIRMNAAQATIRNTDSEALLNGGVSIRSSTGYVLRTESMISQWERTAAETLGPVSGSGPAGTLQAGKMTIRPTGDGGDVQILFTGGVKLVYEPPKKESAVP